MSQNIQTTVVIMFIIHIKSVNFIENKLARVIEIMGGEF
jgi:hypothetical protein